MLGALVGFAALPALFAPEGAAGALSPLTAAADFGLGGVPTLVALAGAALWVVPCVAAGVDAAYPVDGSTRAMLPA